MATPFYHGSRCNTIFQTVEPPNCRTGMEKRDCYGKASLEAPRSETPNNTILNNPTLMGTKILRNTLKKDVRIGHAMTGGGGDGRVATIRLKICLRKNKHGKDCMR